MKQLLFTFLFFLTISYSLSAQINEVDWVKNYRLLGSTSEFYGLVADFWVDTDGNSHLLTAANSPIEADSVTIVGEEFPTTTLYYFMTNDEGQFIREKTFSTVTDFGDPEETQARIAGDNAGNIYIATLYNQAIDLGNSVTLPPPACNCNALFIAKLNPEGTPMWVKSIETEDGTGLLPAGLGCDAAGNLYLATSTDNNTIVVDGNTFTNEADNSQFVLKMDGNGTLIWGKTLEPGSNQARPYTFSVAPNGQFALSGDYINGVNFGNNVVLESPGLGGGQYVVLYNELGEPQWARSFISDEYMDILDIDLNNSGSVYLTLDFAGSLQLDGTNILNTGIANFAGCVMILGPTAFSIPMYATNNNESYVFLGVAVDDSNNYYSGGFLFDETVVIDNNILGFVDCADALVATGNPNTPPTAANIGGVGCEGIVNIGYGNTIDVDDAGYLYVSGSLLEGAAIGGQFFSGNGVFVAKINTGTSGVAAAPVQTKMLVAPNPSSGSFTVRFDQIPQDGRLSVVDISGKLVFERQNIVSQQVDVQLSVPNGQYFLQMTDNTGTTVHKLTVVH